MKTPWIKSLALLGFLAMQSHAIFGIGGHWTPVPGLEVKASKDIISRGSSLSGNHTLTLNEQGLSGAQGFGGKLWIDFLPLIDLEFTGNVQFGYYDVAVTSSQGSGVIPLNFDLGTFGVEGKPFFARSYADVAVLYPFLKFPPVISLIKLYGGGGLTFGAATPIVSPAFAKAALDKAVAQGKYDPDTDSDGSKAAPIIVNAIEDADFESGMGWFLQFGAHAKLPIIPIAAYADAKYRVVSFNPSLVDGNGLNFELGVALAF